MLSYRHGFHAGNHADALKHAVLVHLLGYLTRKDKPLWYVDTHAGAADYELDSAWAQKKCEFETGIGRLWPRDDAPALVAGYLDQVRALNPDGRLRLYPGSAQIAMQLLRDQDRLRLFELHSTEGRGLAEHFAGASPRVLVQAGDGFDGLRAVLPPPSRRGLVLIDPSYEDKRDYSRARATLEDALQRFATGVYALWYPIVQRRESDAFPASLKRLQAKDWLHVALRVKAPAADGYGLHGSGLFILNPPWDLPRLLAEAMPYLVRVLGQDASAGYDLESELA
ncbi:MAG: 23S rRNA (adenine(2030)-N(6))-methyltransferase RlmJ [Betaproteobacteria bacterium]